MKITFNVEFDAEKLIRYNGAKRLDKESAMVMINEMAQSHPSALCKALQGQAHMILFEGSKDYTCYVSVVSDMKEIARTDTYTFRNVERIFQKENDIYNYVDIIHIGGDFQKEDAEEEKTADDILCRIVEVLRKVRPETICYENIDADFYHLPDLLFSCGQIRITYDKGLRKACITGLSDHEFEVLDHMLDGE